MGTSRTTHRPTFRIKTKFLLPFEHYKFSENIFKRTQSAIASQAHYQSSIDYIYLNQLLSKMEQEQGSFLCAHSTRKGSFQTYLAQGVTQGFD